ncbi:hypothetical protein [Arthrobacter sp. ISL-69]|uniref:hypothetical protein n=1 Tax=Arthrobacter sp. ISL-69 TaxID=2819113 RepID=UPI001BE84119|nr:hypothetical protein [Arthrobacter sp. ISL-69]MBT2537188.1 hypothetical protein [Arthrobacter sp. ISL-69]
MAFSAVPYALQNSSHSADLFRQAVSSLVPQGGVVSPTDLAVAQTGTPSMNVSIGVGRAWVPGTNVGNVVGGNFSKQAMYFVLNDAAYTTSVATSDPINPRIDVVYVAIEDSQYAGSTNAVVPAVATGVPASGATYPANAPAIPNNAIPLAWITVAANAVSIVNANVTSLRVTAIPYFASVITTDTNWSYSGGLYVDPSPTGKTRVHLNLRLTRIAGGSVALTTSYIQALDFIPVGLRPDGYGITRQSVLQSSAGADVWGLYTRLDKTGKLFLRTDTGTTGIDVNEQFEIDMTWLLP